MRLIICRRCGKSYNRDIWEECPNCARIDISGIVNPYILKYNIINGKTR